MNHTQTHTAKPTLKEQVEQMLSDFQAEVDSWMAKQKADGMSSKDWKTEFRDRRDKIENQINTYTNDVSDMQADAADTWSGFKVGVKDRLDMLQNRAEELWTRATD